MLTIIIAIISSVIAGYLIAIKRNQKIREEIELDHEQSSINSYGLGYIDGWKSANESPENVIMQYKKLEQQWNSEDAQRN